ncbi:MAG: hypothetical protein II415_02840 [Bacteroidaceae bacterium]|jgi:hypothetical protein|nr:hypothetical protein [Bacteroidaceae bacterium]
MSLNEEERKTVVRLQMEKAHANFLCFLLVEIKIMSNFAVQNSKMMAR